MCYVYWYVFDLNETKQSDIKPKPVAKISTARNALILIEILFQMKNYNFVIHLKWTWHHLLQHFIKLKWITLHSHAMGFIFKATTHQTRFATVTVCGSTEICTDIGCGINFLAPLRWCKD